jgi:hypothetical protein
MGLEIRGTILCDPPDRGPQFAGAVWAAFCQQVVHHIQTPVYHPQNNRLIEEFQRQLKVVLKARNCGPDWTGHLPCVMLGLQQLPRMTAACPWQISSMAAN